MAIACGALHAELRPIAYDRVHTDSQSAFAQSVAHAFGVLNADAKQLDIKQKPYDFQAG